MTMKYTTILQPLKLGFTGRIIPVRIWDIIIYQKKLLDNDSGMGGVPDCLHHELLQMISLAKQCIINGSYIK